MKASLTRRTAPLHQVCPFGGRLQAAGWLSNSRGIQAARYVGGGGGGLGVTLRTPCQWTSSTHMSFPPYGKLPTWCIATHISHQLLPAPSAAHTCVHTPETAYTVARHTSACLHHCLHHCLQDDCPYHCSLQQVALPHDSRSTSGACRP